MAQPPRKRENRLRIISDNAILEGRHPKDDRLDFFHYSQALARVIADNDEALTIGIYGAWGMGKTSLLRMLRKELERDPEGNLVVWFSAWRYQSEAHPLAALVRRILERLENADGKRFTKDVDEALGSRLLKGLKALLGSMSLTIGTPSGLPVSASVDVSGEKLTTALTEDGKAPEGPLPYADAFDLLDAVSLPPRKRLVVLIDDLDRCMPDKAVKLIEGIKLAMSRPGFVFVMGLDPSAVHDYLRHTYSKDFGVEGFDGHRYLEKIVQLPFYLPDHSGRMSDFSAALLEVVPEDEHEGFAEILPLIERVCRSVPRAAIRFFNSILIARAIYDSVTADYAGGDVPVVAFAVDRLLQLAWRDVYEVLSSSQECCDTVCAWEAKSVVGGEDLTDELAVVASRMQGDAALKELVFSEACGEWLRNTEWRRATAMFQVTGQEREMSLPQDEDTSPAAGSMRHEPFRGVSAPPGDRAAYNALTEGNLDDEGRARWNESALIQHLWRTGWQEFCGQFAEGHGFDSFREAVHTAIREELPAGVGAGGAFVEEEAVALSWMLMERRIHSELPVGSHSVSIYTTPSCQWCAAAKDFLRELRIAYTEVSVDSDMIKAREMVEKSGQYGVPVIEVDGEVVVGFDRPRLNGLLGVA